jgi:hypothetical protein
MEDKDVERCNDHINDAFRTLLEDATSTVQVIAEAQSDESIDSRPALVVKTHVV